MIPWIIICFLNQQLKTAIGLLIIYLIVTLIRNIIEPKIVGHQIGLHPLLMLLCMYLGAKLFGFLGIITLPVLIMIIINLNDSGIIHLYNPKSIKRKKHITYVIRFLPFSFRLDLLKYRCWCST